MVLKFGFFQPVHVNNFRIIFIFVDKIVNFVNKFDHRQIVAHEFVDKMRKANCRQFMQERNRDARVVGHALLMRTPTAAA